MAYADIVRMRESRDKALELLEAAEKKRHFQGPDHTRILEEATVWVALYRADAIRVGGD